MKKFGKTLALLAAGALLFGSVLSSCSSGSDEDPKISLTADSTTVEVNNTLTLTAKDGDTVLDGLTWSSSKESVATVDGNGLVTGVAAGKAVITASKDGYKNGTFEITVTAKAGEGEGEGEETTQLSVTWKFSDYASELNAPSGTSTALGEEKSCGIAVLGKNIKIRSDGDGVKGTVTEGVTGYAQLSNGKDGALKITLPAGTRKLVLGAKVTDTKIMKVVAEDGVEVLKEFSAESDSNYKDYTYECEYDEETVVYVGTFAASTTVNFKAFNVWTYAKKNAAPEKSLFTANSTAEGYSITVSDPAGIEYSTDGGTNWTDATATISLTTYGTVLFRTKATDDALASSSVSVTVAEYTNTDLPTAEKPSADNFSVVAAANGNDGSITLKSADGIEFLNGEAWEAAQASYTGLAAGTYTFRTAAVEGTSNASDALEVTVGTYTLPVSVETTWNLTDYTKNALYSGIPVRSNGNAAAVITVSAESLNGYLGKGLCLVNGVAAEYVLNKGLGYTKWANDNGGEEVAANANEPLPAIQSAEKIKGPFKVTVSSPTNNAARSLNFYVSSDASTLFNTAAYSNVLSGSDISYIYAGEDDVYVGLGTVSTDGKVYTNISKIVLTAGAAIPPDEFEATAVAFSNEGITGDAITLAKSQAVDGYQLETTLTPAYSTDSVTYSVSGNSSVSVSADGKVTVTDEFTGSETVTVTATAREGVTATLSVTVNTSIPLTNASVAYVRLASETEKEPATWSTSTSIYLTESVKLATTLDKEYTDENITYVWYVGGTEVSGETASIYEFSNTNAGTYSVTVKAKNGEVETGASEAFTVTVSNVLTVFDGSTMKALTDMPSSVTRVDTSSKQAVDSNSKTLNSKNFSYRFKFGGKDTVNNGVHSNALQVAIGTSDAVKVTVYAMCSSSSKTGKVMALGTGDAVEVLSNTGAALAEGTVSVTPDSSGNIYIYAADNAMNVYYLTVDATPASTGE